MVELEIPRLAASLGLKHCDCHINRESAPIEVS
jgi:hypothetical protein